MIEDAEIICRKYPHGVFCEWRGDARGVALVDGMTVFQHLPRGTSPVNKVIRVGDLRVRVIEMKLSMGAYPCDSYYVMLAHNPFGELQALYRSAVRRVLEFSCNLEARIHGFMLKPYEGRQMPFTSWLYERLL
jgi:hypothetical protein